MRLLFIIIVCLLHIAGVAEGKKTKPTFKSYGKAVERLHGCEICETMVHEAFDMSVDLHRNATERGYPLREEELLTQILDGVCNPYIKPGHWLRLIDIQVNVNVNDKVTSLKALPFYTKCQRDCTTLANACQDILDSDAADDLPLLLYKLTKTVKAIAKIVCGDVCATSAKLLKTTKLPERIIHEVMDELPDEIETKEMDIEAVMDDMERARGGVGGAPPMEVFSRNEMLNMQDAIVQGDASRLRDLDPSADDLTDEDLAYLKEMYAQDGAAHSEEDV